DVRSTSATPLGGSTVTGRLAIAKYDSTGAGIGAITVSPSDSIQFYSIVVDPQDNIYCTGMISGTSRFGSTNVTVSGQADALVKIDPQGNVSWVRAFQGPGFYSAWP